MFLEGRVDHWREKKNAAAASYMGTCASELHPGIAPAPHTPCGPARSKEAQAREGNRQTALP